jgi:hypothetical protein
MAAVSLGKSDSTATTYIPDLTKAVISNRFGLQPIVVSVGFFRVSNQLMQQIIIPMAANPVTIALVCRSWKQLVYPTMQGALQNKLTAIDQQIASASAQSYNCTEDVQTMMDNYGALLVHEEQLQSLAKKSYPALLPQAQNSPTKDDCVIV